VTRDAEGALRCQGSLARLAAELGGGSRRALPDGRRPFGAAGALVQQRSAASATGPFWRCSAPSWRSAGRGRNAAVAPCVLRYTAAAARRGAARLFL